MEVRDPAVEVRAVEGAPQSASAPRPQRGTRAVDNDRTRSSRTDNIMPASHLRNQRREPSAPRVEHRVQLTSAKGDSTQPPHIRVRWIF